jgi:hypothetical protein
MSGVFPCMKTYLVAGAVVAVAVLTSGCTATSPTTPTSSVAATAPSACSYAVRLDVLPTWARVGFSDPSPSGMPYTLGDKGRILGIIFGYPLAAPPRSAGLNNKILWVASPTPDDGSTDQDGAASGDLKIDARLAGATDTVHREVPGGPGPSIIDMPRPGCWHLTLTWSNHTDTLDLRYEAASQ